MTADPRDATINYINDKFVIPNWTTYVNEAWFEVSRQRDPQIYLPTNDEKYRSLTTHTQRDLDRTTSPIIKDSIVFVYVSGYDKTTRDAMRDEMIRIFELADAENPETLIDYIYILNSYPIDRDKNKNCLTWVEVFEIQVLF